MIVPHVAGPDIRHRRDVVQRLARNRGRTAIGLRDRQIGLGSGSRVDHLGTKGSMEHTFGG